MPLQLISPAGHWQAPAAQTIPLRHAVKQFPQCALFEFKSTHAPLQLVNPGPHMVVQTPPEQTSATAQVVGQVPQCAGLLLRS